MFSQPVYGIDISVHQGDISFQAIVDAGLEFCWIKTTEGTGFTDPKWRRNRAEAERFADRLKSGGYHFARADDGGGVGWARDAMNEARDFVRAGGMDLNLPGALDMEHTALSPPVTIAWSSAWCDEVEQLTGKHAAIYVGAWFSPVDATGDGDTDAIPNAAELHRCWWWMPAYAAGDPVDPNPHELRWPAQNGPREMDGWQYTSNGRIAGYDGRLDLNVTSRENFRRLLTMSGYDETPTPEEEVEEVGMTYMAMSGNGNRTWLTRKDRSTGLTPGMVAGLTNGADEPVHPDGTPIEGGWESPWAGLCYWEMVDGCMTTRALTTDNADYLKSIAYAQAVQGTKVTVVDLGFVDDKVLGSKTVIPGVASS
jgi:GH25 family lysozyme M1 (1,4-beta-N-acetylmuramidase)